MRWGICGLEPVAVEGVENVNLTHLVTEVCQLAILLYACIDD